MLVFLLLFNVLFGSELCVYVDVKEQTIPVTCTFKNQGSLLPPPHLKELQKVIVFDWNVNSKTRVIQTQGSLHLNFIYTKNTLTCSVGSARLGPITLTGNLITDRERCHALDDALYEALFQEKGIASLHILYASQVEEKGLTTSTIHECCYDGGHDRVVSQPTSLQFSPIYLPPQKGKPTHYIYVSYIQNQAKLCVGSLQIFSSQRISPLPGNQWMPSFSLQKDRLAYVCDMTGNPEIYLQSFDAHKGLIGYPQQIFTAPHGAQASPVFSPQGDQIACVSNKDGYPRIYLVDASGKSSILTTQLRENTSPAWSPDGTKIAYSGNIDGTRQIWIYDRLMHEHQQLTDGPDHKENPSWAPNSIHIMYNTEGIHHALYLIDIRTKNSTLILEGTDKKRFPAWEPFSP